MVLPKTEEPDDVMGKYLEDVSKQRSYREEMKTCTKKEGGMLQLHDTKLMDSRHNRKRGYSQGLPEEIGSGGLSSMSRGGERGHGAEPTVRGAGESGRARGHNSSNRPSTSGFLCRPPCLHTPLRIISMGRGTPPS
ncbi:unnamed protein product [Nezara viridula]|uniref:Uncharacterized protein n=1 Tax=Nezara viridula TaxID=85310 RepID=A0A9P0HHK3_NEZVI|nr:unnamed protein product [Nezara viridula]